MIKFEPITFDNHRDVCRLEVLPEQQAFVASATMTLAQSYVIATNDPFPPLTYAIYDGELLVGLIFMDYEPVGINDYSDENCYCIIRLIIDKAHQGKGYGTAAIRQAIELLSTKPQGDAACIFITYKDDNPAAKHIYEKLGFVPTGAFNEQDEIIARYELD